MDILDQIEMEWTSHERMRRHSERMAKVRFALAYTKSVEGIPIRCFGQVVMFHLN